MIILIILALLIISFSMSLWSLRSELEKHKAIHEVEGELAKGKILYQAPSELDRSR